MYEHSHANGPNPSCADVVAVMSLDVGDVIVVFGRRVR